MEFPDLGKHCSEPTCNRLDFLPVKCDSCNKVFCCNHFSYERHACPTAHRKDVQVPICPLCGQPVPTAPGVEPDLTVGQHIDQQCKSDTKKIFNNRCSFKGCKRKELIPVTCSQCNRNFCLRHRHTSDHDCKKIDETTSSTSNGTSSSQNVFRSDNDEAHRKMAANAAEYRRTKKPTSLFNMNMKPRLPSRTAAPAARTGSSTTQVQSIQGNISEDEALARAIALSIMELDETADRNRRNEAAANVAAQQQNSTVSVGGRDGQASHKDKCSLS